MTPAILFSIAVLLVLLGLYNFLGHRASKKEWKKKIGGWFDKNQERESFIVVLGEKFDRTVHAQKVKDQLIRANVPLNASEFYAFLIVGGLGVAFLASNFFNIGVFISVLLGAVVMEISRRSLFYFRRHKYQERLNAQLPDICRILANGTRSGMTLNQAISLAARELPEPAKSEFRRMNNELALGVDFNQVMEQLQVRVPSRDFQIFVATLIIQKKAGSDLFAVLDEMANTLDERKMLAQEIKSMTAEQKYIAYILPAMPIALVLMMNIVMDGFIDPLFSGVGLILLALFVAGTVLTFFLVRKVTDIRV
ncbi:type II secretion system F family protein [Natribacillus halophilus]|uniref:Tight adherence protein B n=1 Tax=Natribacillus halophilus TaxID=549003 RepID=A0A1G8QCJ1_9BACI|nr:type II secretion system F family protein [Natribacillus halophilus]SDJ02175.1 tight adherence protein B [Natribacillus halophilus]